MEDKKLKDEEMEKEYAERLGITVGEYRKRKAKALKDLDKNFEIASQRLNTSELFVSKEDTKSRGR